MRRKATIIVILFVFGTLGMLLAADNPKAEAIESLDNAKAMLNKGQYAQAQDELDYAQTKISELMSGDLLRFIPDAPAGFTLEDKSSQSLGQAGAIIGSANSIAATGDYSKDDMEFSITIAVGGLAGQSGGLLGGLAAMFGGMSDVGGTRTIRIKGNNATLEFNEEEESGSITIQLGNKVTVIVDGTDIEDTDDLKTLAEQVDYNALQKAF